MRLASYLAEGRPSCGVIVGDRIADIGASTGVPGLRQAIEAGVDFAGLSPSAPSLELDQVTLLPPIWDTDRIICVGLNYKSHLEELGFPPPEIPMLFVRFADSLVGHGQPLVRPKLSHEFDYEGELAVVVGRPGRHIPRSEALDHVAGYACFNDGSLRDFQTRGVQFLPGKSFHRSGAFGPWLVTPDEHTPAAGTTLTTRLNGVEVQRADLGDLLFDVADLISFVSGILPLHAGDVIATGTTGGVGAARTPQLWIKPGDTIEVDIDGVGVLANGVIDEE